jgi:hypothetical protein
MNNPNAVQFWPVRTYVDYGQVQYADFSRIAVQDLSNVQYFVPSDSEEEEEDDDDDDAIEEGECRMTLHG